MQARKNNSILRKKLMKGIKFITIWKNLTINMILILINTNLIDFREK